MDFMNSPYAAPGPYPEIGELKRNERYAREMLDDMAGCVSEMSAISLYVYNHIIEEPQCPDISQTFIGIAMVEMHHLDIFGTLAFALGENPRLWTCKGNNKNYWTPAYNEYPIAFFPLIRNAIESELEAIEKYQQQIERIDDETVVKCLQRIIEDEQLHVEILTGILQKA